MTLCTDFGWSDPYVGLMKGAIWRASNKVQVIDLAHELPAGDIEAGAFHLWSAIGRFGSGAVHVAVVDPGVGTTRRILAVSTEDGYWLAPDNGVLGTVLAHSTDTDVRAVDLEHLGITPASATFHGRDAFAPVAAWLATGRYGFGALGPRVADVERRDPVFDGAERIVHVDRYGNLISNVRGAAKEPAVRVGVAGRELALRRTFADVEPGQLLAYVGSFGLIEIAVRDGSAGDLLGLRRGAPITVHAA